MIDKVKRPKLFLQLCGASSRLQGLYNQFYGLRRLNHFLRSEHIQADTHPLFTVASNQLIKKRDCNNSLAKAKNLLYCQYGHSYHTNSNIHNRGKVSWGLLEKLERIVNDRLQYDDKEVYDLLIFFINSDPFDPKDFQDVVRVVEILKIRNFEHPLELIEKVLRSKNKLTEADICYFICDNTNTSIDWIITLKHCNIDYTQKLLKAVMKNYYRLCIRILKGGTVESTENAREVYERGLEAFDRTRDNFINPTGRTVKITTVSKSATGKPLYDVDGMSSILRDVNGEPIYRTIMIHDHMMLMHNQFKEYNNCIGMYYDRPRFLKIRSITLRNVIIALCNVKRAAYAINLYKKIEDRIRRIFPDHPSLCEDADYADYADYAPKCNVKNHKTPALRDGSGNALTNGVYRHLDLYNPALMISVFEACYIAGDCKTIEALSERLPYDVSTGEQFVSLIIRTYAKVGGADFAWQNLTDSLKNSSHQFKLNVCMNMTRDFLIVGDHANAMRVLDIWGNEFRKSDCKIFLIYDCFRMDAYRLANDFNMVQQCFDQHISALDIELDKRSLMHMSKFIKGLPLATYLQACVSTGNWHIAIEMYEKEPFMIFFSKTFNS